MTTHLARIRCSIVAVVALAAGCGGGGGDASLAAPGPAPAPSTAPAPAPAPTPAPDTSCGLSDFPARVLARVNQLRAAGASCGAQGSFAPAAALAWNAALSNAVAGHSSDMAAGNFFSHTGSGGSTLGSRATAAGYAWDRLGENIAAGPITVDTVMDGWMASDGHCANIMNPDFRDIGVACVSGTPADTYRSYWTMDLGRSP